MSDQMFRLATELKQHTDKTWECINDKDKTKFVPDHAAAAHQTIKKMSKFIIKGLDGELSNYYPASELILDGSFQALKDYFD